MTDSAFRRLVKRQGGCDLVVTEMVSSEGLVRGIDRTLEYAEFTEEERPVAVQIFGGDPERMAAAAQVVQDIGADIVDVNMGCPVPKIAKGHAGCRLMREPEQAAAIVRAMARAVTIPVTVKMRAGWNEHEINAPDLARRVEDAGAAAIAVHGRTAAQSYSGRSDWDLIREVAASVSIPVYGNGDCVEAEDLVDRLSEGRVSGILVGRGALRNPWLLRQASDLLAGRSPREVTLADRGRFLLEYLDLLLNERVAEPAGFRHTAPLAAMAAAGAGVARHGLAAGLDGPSDDEGPGLGADHSHAAPARGRERWVINKVRALSAWYTKGLDNGGHLRQAINHTDSIAALRDLIRQWFPVPA